MAVQPVGFRASGKFRSAAQLVAETRNVRPVDLGVAYARGRYIASVTCAECHGPKLEGGRAAKGSIPDLVVAGGYTPGEFEKLITRGIPTGGRTIREMMSGVATTRFSHLTPHERDELYAYLKARAEKAD
jgi:mono/diheme cytochrome c family protein